MLLDLPLLLVDCAAVALFVLVLSTVRKLLAHARQPRLSLPPGPRGYPLIGNLMDVPRKSPWEIYNQMAQKYGSLMSLRTMGQTILVINSATVARDLLEKRGLTWSDRPVFPLFDMMGLYSWNVALKPHSDEHRLERRIADHGLRPNAITAYRAMETFRAHELLRSLLRDPAGFSDHIKLSITYGYDLKSIDNAYVVNAHELNQTVLSVTFSAAGLINIFPMFKHLPSWFPGMGGMRLVPHIKQLAREIVDVPFDFVKAAIHDGTAKASLSHEYLTAHEGFELPPNDQQTRIKNVAATLYDGAVETTSTLLTNFFLALLFFPETQRKAQAELDTIVGRDRLPNLDDRDTLPYIKAIYLELLRWRVISPLGVPRANAEDEVYDGYILPKGSVVFVNLWAMLHDPVKYPDPDSFRPERFLTEDGHFKDDPDIEAAYGFGRRICPGRFLAQQMTLVTIMSVLAVFTVDYAKDEYGSEIPVMGEHTVDVPMLSVPLPFECSITPRDDKALALIHSTDL
ncbi:cytochrome P450 [Stereum hirsutum FP-91666 SS1]|uniref:Cytochrome P450 n=1 Tax=Stereum hirsutum (strain FP-91666) TaxID=721885 RepID=R7RXN8_STEHR|nr:cytochrome P450 [Stereum hirsutum FP-91666 SS1]EIM79655.1 cytochrome P450 [Stereum hirsutum FP-91666 SS1]